MIIGTAGHINHGKTTLVRALTGIDTDRLKEEKARGISIELGYAYTPLPDGSVLGYIDVPGHERLVHTMVAGASGIDFALLAIAADDGVMPQTREHLAILQVLGVAAGAVALTKADRVDAARLAAVQDEIAAVLSGTSLQDAAVFPLNAAAADDAGVAALRRHLHQAAACTAARSDAGGFRLAVDRVFTLPGQGTVVTGTVFSGRVQAGDSLVLMPSGASVRVRSIHAQHQPSTSGRAGQRCALNLAGIDKEAIARGDWIAAPQLLAPSRHLDVRLQLLPGEDAALGQWAPLHVHLGAAHQVAHLVPLEGEDLKPGRRARAQLVFDTPLCALAGDRFIVRNAQATRTLGGGRVLDPAAPERRRRSPQRLQYLDAVEALLDGQGLGALLEHAPRGLSFGSLRRLTGLPGEQSPLPDDALVIDGAPRAAERYAILRRHWQALREQVLDALRSFHQQAPDEAGPDAGRLRRIAAPELAEPLWQRLLEELAQEQQLRRDGPWLRLPEHVITLSDEDQALLRRLQPLLDSGHFDPPWVRDLATTVGEPEERVRQVLRKLVRQGSVYQVVPDLFFSAGSIRELAQLIAGLVLRDGKVEAAGYRDATGLGRKRAIQILEFFDRVGYTRRVRDAHVLRADSGWQVAP